MNNLTESFFDRGQAKHTKIKLEILNRYVIPWMRKVVLNRQGSNSCCIIDTFAGAGVYSDGSIGSPIILLNEAIDFIKQAKEKNFKINRILLTFIEKDENNYTQLKQSIENIIEEELNDAEVNSLKKYPQLYIAIENGTHEEFLKELTESVENIIPTIFFMDPFGFGLPFELNRKILNNYSNVELLINYMYEEINRFISVNSVQKKMKELFGLEDMSNIINDIKDTKIEQRREIIKGAYVKNLKYAGAKETLTFDIYSERGQLKMSMIFATKSLIGFDTMKEVLDGISNTGKLEYIPNRDVENIQISIDGFETKLDKEQELANYLYKNVKGRKIQIQELIKIARKHPYIPSKYTKKALIALQDIGRIKKIYRKSGKSIKKNSFPNDAYVIII